MPGLPWEVFTVMDRQQNEGTKPCKWQQQPRFLLNVSASPCSFPLVALWPTMFTVLCICFAKSCPFTCRILNKFYSAYLRYITKSSGTLIEKGLLCWSKLTQKHLARALLFLWQEQVNLLIYHGLYVRCSCVTCGPHILHYIPRFLESNKFPTGYFLSYVDSLPPPSLAWWPRLCSLRPLHILIC
jgi:hypothetical protein